MTRQAHWKEDLVYPTARYVGGNRREAERKACWDGMGVTEGAAWQREAAFPGRASE